MKTFFSIILLGIIAFSCQKELGFENVAATLPTLTTTPLTSITSTTATSGGNITDDGGAIITARGVCWSTSANPTVALSTKTSNGTGSGIFASIITGLTATTTYYVRAYATNSEGTAYGNEISFTTTNTSTALPTVTTRYLSSITRTTAEGGGEVVADGGATVTARGACWSTTANPTIALTTKTTDGTGTGTFTSNLTGLTAGTTYHVRAYATNSVGTSYGGDSVFTTAPPPTIPTVTTTPISAITSTFANSGGTVSSDGGAAVTVRGICWSTTANPTIALSTKTTDGAGIGTFITSITDLTASTTYHVRAYATNSVGTAYGNDINFLTPLPTPDIYVGGYEAGTMVEFVAKTWKNGVPTTLSDGTSDATVNAVFATGTDFYAAGSIQNHTSGSPEPKLWKNGVVTALPGLCGGAASSVFVAGTDVHISGFTATSNPGCAAISPKAVTWKNNVLTELTDGTSPAQTSSVFVSGTDTYIAGIELLPGNGTMIAKVWKNGVATALTDGSINAYAHAVFVSGTDVYVAGEENVIGGVAYAAKIWKNGVGTSLNNGIHDTFLNSIYVSGTDVYAVGYEETDIPLKSVAKIWKNGVPTALTNGANDARAYSVFVFGTDVYVAGYENNGTKDIAKIWKNGVASSLTNGTQNAAAYSVFVK
ncbi:MAG: hypothetical protein IPN43_08660 [Chitinophagaceae bacterium]|nr:hypothetical protein [Chitinophagaceae bacterium]MBL0200500.1 hypothetical protein [Chitinophagaceae bacterium]